MKHVSQGQNLFQKRQSGRELPALEKRRHPLILAGVLDHGPGQNGFTAFLGSWTCAIEPNVSSKAANSDRDTECAIGKTIRFLDGCSRSFSFQLEN
jgi:hypothetical protein